MTPCSPHVPCGAGHEEAPGLRHREEAPGLGRFLALALIVVSVSPAGARDDLFVAVEVESEWAQGTSTHRADKLELLVQPEVELELPRGFDLRAVGRARLSALDNLEPGQPTQFERSSWNRVLQAGDRVDLELRELVLEGPVGPLWVRVGKQQIVWGTADDLKVLDVVNPQDFREFILDDFEDSRIPLWALDVEIPVGDATLELVWLPDPTFHDLAERDAPFAFTSPLLVGPAPPPGVPVVVRPVDRPRRALSDSDAGARLRASWRGWDLSLAYLYRYDDLAIPFRRLPAAPGDPLVVEPGYERTHLVGGAFANSFGELTLRGEMGYSTDRFLPTASPSDPDGVTESGELLSVLGLDWYGLSDAVVSVQLFHSWVARSASGLLRDRHEWNVTAFVRRSLLRDRLHAELTWVVGLNRGDGILRPRVSYEVSDELEVWIGADVFHGAEDGLFGQFDPLDRVVVGARRTF